MSFQDLRDFWDSFVLFFEKKIEKPVFDPNQPFVDNLQS